MTGGESSCESIEILIEIYWGKSLSLVLRDGTTKNISTLEQARHWLRRRWPAEDRSRNLALRQIDAAMECLVPVAAARRAFVAAARAAGLMPAESAVLTPQPLTA